MPKKLATAAKKQEGTPIGNRISHAWMEEARRGRQIFIDETIREDIGHRYKEFECLRNNRVLILDKDNNETVRGHYIYPSYYVNKNIKKFSGAAEKGPKTVHDSRDRKKLEDLTRKIYEYCVGFTEKKPTFVYDLEDEKIIKGKFRRTPQNILYHVLYSIGDAFGRIGTVKDRTPDYKAKGKKRVLTPPNSMEDLGKKIGLLKEYVERESCPGVIPESSVALASKQLNSLYFMVFGYANAALGDTGGYPTGEELSNVLDVYAMAGLLDTRNVQRKLGKYGKGIKRLRHHR